jgi:hypothetical protein
MMAGRFDWYQATIEGEVAPLLGALAGACSSQVVRESLQRAPHGYGGGCRLSDTQGRVADVWWGGRHELPHVVSSGESAQAVAEVLRAEYPGRHRVTRGDACIDFADPGAYDVLQGIALGVAQDRGIRVGTAGDHLLTKQGRTLYLGAPSSHTRMRLYDKADELRAKFHADPRRLATVPDELARLEVQVRPQTLQAKRAAASIDPLSLMGSTAWTRELIRRVGGVDLEPFEAGKVWRQADDERAMAAMLAQYGGLLGRLCADLGSWECVGLQLGHDLAERSRAKGRRP